MRLDAVVRRLDWPQIEAQLNEDGHAVMRGLLGGEAMDGGWRAEGWVPELAQLCGIGAAGRATALAAEGLGLGERYTLPTAPPPGLAVLCRQVYLHLAPIANRWQAALGEARSHPDALDLWSAPVDSSSAVHAVRSSLTCLRTGGHEALHSHGKRPDAFPLQLVALLSEPGLDFTGGEFVMTEQRPRMQSRPMVLPLRRGDVAIIPVAQRPHRGRKGCYRVNLKHAVSRVRSGERIGLDLLLDDAIWRQA